jgi:hypothetical protein
LNKHGETIVFEPKAFDKYFESGVRPAFWLRHDAATAFGSNTELCVLNEGIAFRLPLAEVANPVKIRELIESGHDSISIGFTELTTRNDVLFGHPVKIIEEAEIREVSLVPRGACKEAFCRLIDASHEPPLRESVNSAMFGVEYGLHNIKIIKEDNEAALEHLNAKLSALEADSNYEQHTARRSISADEMNRRTTAQYNKFAASVRRQRVW